MFVQVNFVAAIDVYEDGEAGLLLCYNCKCFLPKKSVCVCVCVCLFIKLINIVIKMHDYLVNLIPPERYT